MEQAKTVEEIVQEAVAKATEGIMADVDLKVQRAFEIGAEIGAAKGAEIGAQAAIHAIETENRRFAKVKHDRRLRNTKLLLQHYRSLNSHYENAVWEDDESTTAESFAEIMELMDSRSYNDKVIVESIRQSTRKTCIIMRHVNAMLEQYEAMCHSSNRQDDERHWRVIKAMYLDRRRTTAVDVAEAENIDKRTVYKDIDAAVEDLTALLFGVEGIDKL